jgi:hypothetical protein
MPDCRSADPVALVGVALVRAFSRFTHGSVAWASSAQADPIAVPARPSFDLVVPPRRLPANLCTYNAGRYPMTRGLCASVHHLSGRLAGLRQDSPPPRVACLALPSLPPCSWPCSIPTGSPPISSLVRQCGRNAAFFSDNLRHSFFARFAAARSAWRVGLCELALADVLAARPTVRHLLGETSVAT